jgi:hypothetical protein
MLGRLALATGDVAEAGEHLAAAARCFRDGDYLTELATTLVDLAEQARAMGDLEAAERHAAEAITISGPRGMVLVHCTALAARARIRATQATATTSPAVNQGRDAPDAALRLATRHQLAWHELDAMRAHVLLDRAEGRDREWAARTEDLHARLVPPDLDPNPLDAIRAHVLLDRAEGRHSQPDDLHARLVRPDPGRNLLASVEQPVIRPERRRESRLATNRWRWPTRKSGRSKGRS